MWLLWNTIYGTFHFFQMGNPYKKNILRPPLLDRHLSSSVYFCFNCEPNLDRHKLTDMSPSYCAGGLKKEMLHKRIIALFRGINLLYEGHQAETREFPQELHIDPTLTNGIYKKKL